MHGIDKSAINRKGQISIKGVSRTQADNKGLGLGGGTGDVVSLQGIVGKPRLTERIFAIVNEVFENIHGWDEADVSDPTNPKIMDGGRRGLVSVNDSSSSSDGGNSSSDEVESEVITDQAAYDFNGNSHPIGTVIYIQRTSFDAWGIICCDSVSSSDRPEQWLIDCDAGTITKVGGDGGSGGGSGNTSSSGVIVSDPANNGGSGNSNDPAPPDGGI